MIIYPIIVIITPLILGFILTLYLNKESSIVKVPSIITYITFAINLLVIIAISLNLIPNLPPSNNLEFFTYSVPTIFVLILSLILLSIKRVKYLFRLISYFTFASIVGGITAVVLTNYKSLDLALLVIIEIFFMAIFYWMTFILYKQENPNAKLATEIKFSRGIFKTNTKSGIYKKLKKNSAIERINGNEAIKRILKYLLVISILTGFYILVFYFLIPTPWLPGAWK